MIKLFKRIICLAVVMIMSMSLFGCGEDDGSGYIFRYDITGNPTNLDPQLASDSSSRLVLANICEGLLKAGDGGRIENGVINGYTLSDDGLVYTFDLKRDVYWTGEGGYEANMTSADFIFAFNRIFDPDTGSPYADDFSCIKNGSAVNRGLAPADSLGVSAPDKYTLTITLEKPNANFLYLLTTTAAMPCNEYFFKSTMGKYGLSAETTFSNGSFFLKEWNYDPYWNNNYIILRRNKLNSERDYVYPYSINFFIKSDNSEFESDYLAGETDIIKSNGKNEKLFDSAKYIETQISSAGLLFNTENEILANKNIRKALAESIDRDALPEYSNLTPAFGIVPTQVSLLNKSYRELASERSLGEFNAKYALTDLYNGFNELDIASADGIAIMVSEDFYNPEALRDITAQWSEKLQLMCGVEIVSANEYKTRLETKDYEIAVIEAVCEYNSPDAVLDGFSAADGDSICGFAGSQLDIALNRFKNSASLSDSVSALTEAEKAIISEHIYVPLYYPKNYLIFSDKADGIAYNPFSDQIYFEKAKYFE